jgi:transcriptional regulator with XRE-family HTH domain
MKLNTQKVVETRRSLRKSRAWLANKIERTENMVYKLERGDVQPSEDTLFRISKALDVPVGDLIKDEKGDAA